MMRPRSDLRSPRFGPLYAYGVETTVAVDFDIGEQTHEALFGKMLEASLA